MLLTYTTYRWILLPELTYSPRRPSDDDPAPSRSSAASRERDAMKSHRSAFFSDALRARVSAEIALGGDHFTVTETTRG